MLTIHKMNVGYISWFWYIYKIEKACFDTKSEQIRSDESHTWSTICTHLYFSSNIIITSSRNHNSLWTWNKFKRGKSANIAFKYIFATCFLLPWSWYYTIVEYFVTLISSFCNLSKKNIKYVVCIIVKVIMVRNYIYCLS